MNNPCQWCNELEDDEFGSLGSYMAEFDEDWCCGAPAIAKRWGAWFCAIHYDRMAEIYGEQKDDFA